jgi:hypothetical protein
VRQQTNKHNGPQRRGRYRQGYYIPTNPTKYIGDPSKIIFRSSWEYYFCKYCDETPEILTWSSEPIAIPYISPLDNKEHSYFVDFYMKLQKGEEQIEYLVEIKPSKSLKQPMMKEGLTTIKRLKEYNENAKTWVVNRAKFRAAEEFARITNKKFIIVTEEFLFKRSNGNGKSR